MISDREGYEAIMALIEGAAALPESGGTLQVSPELAAVCRGMVIERDGPAVGTTHLQEVEK